MDSQVINGLIQSVRDNCTGCKESRIKVVGQHKSEYLLVAWNQHPGSQQNAVTVVGVTDLTCQELKILYKHEKEINVVNCTLNDEHSLLGFVTVKLKDKSGSHGKRHKQAVYRAYLAEIAPQNRVFYLNLERTSYLMLHFLAATEIPTEENHAGENQLLPVLTESHLLVLLHKESVGLYHISLTTKKETGVGLSGEPRKQQIFTQKFTWAQWNSGRQQLYILYHRKHIPPSESSHQSTDKVRKSSQPVSSTPKSSRKQSAVRKSPSPSGSDTQPVLACYQFTPQATVNLMMEVFLDHLPVPMTTEHSIYYEAGLAQVIPDASINMTVLSQHNGCMFICFQHPPKVNDSPKVKVTSNVKVTPKLKVSSSGDPADEYIIIPDQTEGKLTSPTSDIPPLQYSVVLPHRDLTLHCSFATVPDMTSQHLSFLLLGDYIMVQLADRWQHLLNVGSDFDLLHHHFSTATMPCTDTAGCYTLGDKPLRILAQLTPLRPSNDKTSSKPVCQVYNSQSQCIETVDLDTDYITEMFCSDPTSRHSLLHLATLHSKDLTLVIKLFAALAKDVFDPDIVSLIQEFIIGSTYAQFSRHCPKSLIKYFPFTTRSVLPRQLVRDKDGNQLYTITYRDSLSIDMPTSKHDQSKQSFWNLLANQRAASISNNNIQQSMRFSHSLLKGMIDRKSGGQMQSDHYYSSLTELSIPTKISLFKRISNAAKSAFRSSSPENNSDNALHQTQPIKSHSKKTVTKAAGSDRADRKLERLLGREPDFLKVKETEDSNDLINMTSEAIVRYLSRHNKGFSSTQLRRLTEEYMKSQICHCRLLAHILCKITIATDVTMATSLQDVPTPRETSLFHLLERYFLATQEMLCPLPPGFAAYFVKLGYRCLDHRLFLQYADEGIFTVTTEFAQQLLHDLDDSEDNREMKFQVISRLPRGEIYQSLRLWDDPAAQDIVCQHYTAQLNWDNPSPRRETETDPCQEPDPYVGEKDPFQEVTEDSSVTFEDGRKRSTRMESVPSGGSSDTESLLADMIPDFPPITAFLQLLQSKDPDLLVAASDMDVHVDSAYLTASMLDIT